MSDSRAHAALGRYERLERIDEGTFGAVYLGVDHDTGQRVALKELTRVTPATLAQFKREFRALQEIHHRNLVRLDALYQEAGRWTIAMELVDGTDLSNYVYLDHEVRCFDEARLRAAFLQLTDALSALHAAGFVHRDLKPKNVRVTPEGRVVLLDFGLAEPIAPRGASSRSGYGTVAYAAPEQADLEPVGPAADFYAFGVCLHEALTGVIPILAASPIETLEAKRQRAAAWPSASADDIPADLDELCHALLAVAPTERPDARAIRKLLAAGDAVSLPSTQPGTWLNLQQPTSALFMGREAELSQLAAAFARARDGHPQVVLIEGESGIGKSALVEHFLSQASAGLTLRGRCYENELLSYKAFDAAVEELTDYLAGLPSAQRKQLLPEGAGLLARLFAPLSTLHDLPPAPEGTSADPAVQRLDAFAAFAELLARLGEHAPLIVFIDDLQWADAESFALLRACMAVPSARSLIIATVRPAAELEGASVDALAALRQHERVRTLALRGLPATAARALSHALMDSRVPAAWLDTMVSECSGHPLFLTMLARFADTRDPRQAHDLTLEGVISARINKLSEKGHKLLDLVAIAGAPLPASLFGRCAELGESELNQTITELCRQRLLRRRRAGDVTCFHDRIRRSVEQSLPLRQKQGLHAQLAAALAADGRVDPAELARHQEAALQLPLALESYVRAADKALTGLAFERAAQLYGRAIELGARLGGDPSQQMRLYTQRGHALARGGRSADAAHDYREAARSASGEEQTRLQILAAVHLLQSAHVDEGMASARELLARLHVAMPSSASATLARLVWDRSCLRLRGLRAHAVARSMTPEQHMRLQALWSLSLPIGWLDPLASAGLTTRHLRLASALGEPAHMAGALAEEAFMRHMGKPHDPAVDELLAHARKLSEQCGQPALELCVTMREGTIAMVRGDMARALERLEHAESIGIQRCPEEPWLLTNVRVSLGSALSLCGQHARLVSRITGWLAEARERNDRFALSLLETMGIGYLRHLMGDRPDECRAALDEALAPWPREPFSFAQFGAMLGVMQAELYRGGDAAQRWVEAERARLDRSFLLKSDLGRTNWLLWQGQAAIAAAVSVEGSRRTALLDQARAHAGALGRLKLRSATIHAGLIEAQLFALAKQYEPALERIRFMLEQAEASGYRALSHGLSYFQGVLEGGDGGAERRRVAEAFFTQQGWRNPSRGRVANLPAIVALE